MSRDRWLGIELRHFAALAAVAQERSFRRAADRLGYVQSAISRQIAYLEHVTGTRLIERSQGPKPVQLTKAGALLLGHANDILAAIEAAKRDMSELDGARPGDVRVGFFPGVGTRILAPTLVAFGRRHPTVRVVATEADTDDPLFEHIRNGSIDLAFTYLPAEPGPFAVRELLRVPWALIVPAGADIADSSRAPSASELVRLPLIGPKSRRLDPWILPQLCGATGEPRIVFRSDSAETVQALAGAGLGAAVLPRLAVQEGDPRIAVIDLGELLTPVSVGLVWLRDRQLYGATGEFRDLVAEVCTAIERRRAEAGRFTRANGAESVARAGAGRG